MKRNSLGKNYIFNTLYQVLNILVPIVTTPYVSRVIGAEGIGEYSFVFSIVMYFSLFGSLGLSTYGQLEAAKYQHNKNKRSYIFWNVTITKSITICIAILIYYIYIFSITKTFRNMYIIQSIYLFAQIIDLSWFLMGIEEFKIISVRNIVVKFLGTVLIFLFVKKQTDLYLYVLILMLTAFIGNLILLPQLCHYIVRPDLSEIKFGKCIRRSMVFFVPTIASSVNQLMDKIMIGTITGSTYQNGIYEQPYKIIQMIVPVVTSLSVVMLPRVTQMYNSNDYDNIKGLLQKGIAFILSLSAPMVMGIISVSSVFIPLFLGSEYYDSIVIIQCMAPLIGLLGLNSIIGRACLMSKGNQWKYNIGVIVGAIVNISMNFLLISIIGALGAVITSIVSEFIILCIFIYYSKDLIEVKELFKTTGRYLSMSLIMAVVIYPISYLSLDKKMILVVQIVAGIMIYIIELVFTKDNIIAVVKGTIIHRKC